MCRTRVVRGTAQRCRGAERWLCGFYAYMFCCLETSAWDQVHVPNSAQVVGVEA